MRYNLNKLSAIKFLFFIFILLQHCELNIDLNEDKGNYPQGSVIVTIKDSLNIPMPGRSVSISSNRDYAATSKITDSDGKVTFNNVPISHGPQKNYTTGTSMPAGDYSYDFSVDYYTDDCCYYLGIRGVFITTDPLNVIIKVPHDLHHIDSVPDPENPGNYCYCQDSTSI